MRKYGKVDSTQADIVAAFRECGFSVLSLASLGNGAPDLLVSRGNKNYLVECKSTFTYELTPDQEKFHESWKGPIFIVCDAATVKRFFSKL